MKNYLKFLKAYKVTLLLVVLMLIEAVKNTLVSLTTSNFASTIKLLGTDKIICSLVIFVTNTIALAIATKCKWTLSTYLREFCREIPQ